MHSGQQASGPVSAIARSEYAPLVAALLAFTLQLILAFPGELTHDSREQYAQALSGQFQDWHPPVMAWLWSWFRVVWDAPATMFVFHLALAWTGFGLIASALIRKGYLLAGWLTLGVAFLPPIIWRFSVIEKDVGMAVALLAAFAILYWSRMRFGRTPIALLAISLLLCAYAMLVRANGIFAGAPIVVYALAPQLFRHPIRWLVAAGVVVAIALPASGLVNHGLIRAEKNDPMRSLILFDVVGIAHHSNDMSVLWPGPFTEELVHRCYTPDMWDSLGHKGDCEVFWNSESPEQKTTWAKAILRHPLAYAQHRLAHFNSSIQFAVPAFNFDGRVMMQKAHDKPFTFQPTPTETLADTLIFNPLFLPATSLVLALVLLAFNWPRRGAPQRPEQTAALCLVLSALAYSFAYLVIGVASQPRYHFWTLIAVFLAAAQLVRLPQAPIRLNLGAIAGASAVAATVLATFAIQMALGDARVDLSSPPLESASR